MQGTARAPGTCGELAQGKINGMNFLVTCPVDMYSVANVKLNTGGRIEADRNLYKVRTAVEKTLQFLDRPGLGAEVQISSSIPCGKGMASSSADIAAACAAVGAALGNYLTPAEIADIALSIEPTDGVMFPGIAVFDHVEGSMCRVLGNAPDLEIAVVDLGGTIDTLRFNANAELEMMNRLKENKVAAALEKIEKGIALDDARLVGEGATDSALAHQKILYKHELPRLIQICRQFGGVGINIAHSGTVVGLLFKSGAIEAGHVLERLSGEGFAGAFKTRVIGGGVEILQERAGDQPWQPLHTFTEGTYGKLQRSTG